MSEFGDAIHNSSERTRIQSDLVPARFPRVNGRIHRGLAVLVGQPKMKRDRFLLQRPQPTARHFTNFLDKRNELIVLDGGIKPQFVA